MQDQKLIIDEQERMRKLVLCVKNIEQLKKKPLENLPKIRSELQDAKDLLAAVSIERFEKAVRRILDAYTGRVPEWENQVKSSFGNGLEKRLREMGLSLTGQYPVLKAAFYTLGVNVESLEIGISYGPQRERLAKCQMDPDAVAAQLKAHHERIVRRRFEDREFLAKLHMAYNRQRENSGEQVAISDLLAEFAFLIQERQFRANPLRSNFTEYGRTFFSYDLYRLKERVIDGFELKFVTATREYTQDPCTSLWVPSNEAGDGVHISHVKFVRREP